MLDHELTSGSAKLPLQQLYSYEGSRLLESFLQVPASYLDSRAAQPADSAEASAADWRRHGIALRHRPRRP